ncbi:MAG: hypothetical protein SOX13_06810 [Sodaliphilus sp.]|nr:hypothetical protein [Sodaliphilus sp.]
MMIAARLAGGNLFLPFFGGGFFWWGILGALGAARSSSDFFEGDFVVGDFWEHSEQLGALGFFLRGFVVGGFFFLGGGGVCFGL